MRRYGAAGWELDPQIIRARLASRFCVCFVSSRPDELRRFVVYVVCFGVVVVIISIWPDSRQLSVASQGRRTVFCVEAAAFSGSANVFFCVRRRLLRRSSVEADDDHCAQCNQPARWKGKAS